MNRTFFRKILRTLSAGLLCGAMTAGLLAGCGRTENAPDAAAASSSAAENAASEQENAQTTDVSAPAAEESDAEKTTPQGKVEQTVSIKADAIGTPTKAVIKDNVEDFEEDIDPTGLPFKVHVRYFLDGVEKTPEEMAGVSGSVTIRFEYENLADRTISVNGEQVATKVPFVYLTAVLLPEEHFSAIKVEKGGLTSFKDNTIAYGYAAPGLKELLALPAFEEKLDSVEFEFDEEETEESTAEKSEESAVENPDESAAEEPEEEKIEIPEYVEIRAEAVDFELDFTATIVTNGLFKDMKTDTADDLEELIENVGKFTDAGKELSDASDELYDGAGEFRDALKQYTDGASQLGSGALQLAAAAKQLSDGASKLNSAVSGIDLSGLSGSGESMDFSGAGTAMQQLASDGAVLQEQLATLGQILAAAQTLNEEEAALLKEKGIDLSQIDAAALSGAVQDMNTQMGVLGGYAEAMGKASEAMAGLGEAAAGIGELQKGIGQLADGAGALKKGADQLAGGASRLGSAGGQLLSGYDELRNGIGEFRDGVKEFDEKGIQKFGEIAGTELQDVIDHLRALREADLGYLLYDDPSAEDGSVRFILETEEIKKES